MNVSLVVPVRNEESTIVALWHSIQAQERVPAEVVFVDGGSTDRTSKVIRTFADERITIRLVQASDAYPGEARNVGVAHAQYDWIAFTDAGVVLRPNWLSRLCQTAEDVPAACVIYGSYEPIVRNRFDKCAALAHIVVRNAAMNNIRGPCIPSTLLHRSVFEAAGGFPRFRAAEDLMFMEALDRLNLQIAVAPDAVIDWQMPRGVGATFRRFFTYSQHNLLAGRGRYWHRAIAIYWFMATALFLLALRFPVLFVLPVLGLVMRTVKSVRLRRPGIADDRIGIITYLGVAAVIILIDVATLLGAAAYLIQLATRRGIVRRDMARQAEHLQSP